MARVVKSTAEGSEEVCSLDGRDVGPGRPFDFGRGVYLRREKARDRPAAAGEPPSPPTRWRERVEVRVVLYCLAALLALQFPWAPSKPCGQ